MTRRRRSPEERLAGVARQMVPGTLGGRVISAARTSLPAGLLQTTRPRQTGGGRVYATVVVAAADSHESGIASANYVCDGTNDHVEINQAINDLDLSGRGGRIVLLEGTYNLDDDIDVFNGNAPVVLEGQGPATILKAVASFSGTAGVVRLLEDFCELRDLSVDVNSQPFTGVLMSGNDGRVEDVSIINAVVGALYVDGTRQRNIVTRVRTSTDDSADADCSLDCQGAFTLVENCQVKASSDVGIRLVGQGSRAVGNTVVGGHDSFFGTYGISAVAAYCGIVANIVSGCDTGIYVEAGPGINVAGNVVTDSARIGIDCSGSRCVLAGNVVTGADWHGIYVSDGDDNVVVDNVVWGNGQETHNTWDGIHVANNADRNCIQGNVVRHGGGAAQHRYGLRVDSSLADGTLVTNNDLKDSGATASLSDAGNATITAAGNQA